MHTKQIITILLLTGILLCGLLPAAHAQYGLGLTRQQVKKMIKKQYKEQGVKPVITEERYILRVAEKDGTGKVNKFFYYFGTLDTCIGYTQIFTSDSARRQAVQQKQKEGWQRINKYIYYSNYEISLFLTVRNDTPLYNFNIQRAYGNKSMYDTLIARSKRRADSINIMQDCTEPVVWQPGIKLKWDNYNPGCQFYIPEPNTNKTFCNLYCNAGDKVYAADSSESVPVSIYAVMLPGYSYIADSQFGNEKVLAHEQLYFDIAELVARQLRRDLSQVLLPRNKYRQKIKMMLDDAAITLNKLQQQYDDEVKHNPASPQFTFWQQDIAQKLTELNPYTKHTVEVDIR